MITRKMRSIEKKLLVDEETMQYDEVAGAKL